MTYYEFDVLDEVFMVTDDLSLYYQTHNYSYDKSYKIYSRPNLFGITQRIIGPTFLGYWND